MSRELVVPKLDDVYERFINHSAREVEMTTAAAVIARKIGGGDDVLAPHAGYKNKRVATAGGGRLESFGYTVQLSAPTAALVYMLLAHRDVGVLTKVSGFALLVLQMLMVLDYCRSGSAAAAVTHTLGPQFRRT